MSRSYSNRTSSRGGNIFRRNNKKFNRKKTSKIDPTRFVKPASKQTEEIYEAKHKFQDFKFNELLHRNLTNKGYKIPSPIQDQTIPAGLEGRDVIGIAGTGTGKTAAFALPALNKLINDKKSSAAIIIAPTRELAQQIEVECKALAAGSGLRGALLIGGSSIGNQFRMLKGNPNVVIGTPGRIKDHLQRKTLDLSKFNIVVLDEVDRMLDMGFVDDVREILSQASQERQSFFFSATMDNRVENLINNFSNDPIKISIQSNKASENVHQDVIRYSDNDHRLDQLHDLLISNEVEKVIVFDETQRSVEKLNKILIDRGFSTDAIHGGKTQGQRQRALKKFKGDEINVLVATDVAARGIDVSGVTHVINYSVPQEYEDYIHRIGRAGRAGRTGYAYTFIAG